MSLAGLPMRLPSFNKYSDWRSFWRQQTCPHHRSDSPEYYDMYGRELSFLVGDTTRIQVLELGCGAGSLFSSIGFSQAPTYRGVDFSDKMLDVFRTKYPDVDLICADAATYCEDKAYDLIFSNGFA